MKYLHKYKNQDFKRHRAIVYEIIGWLDVAQQDTSGHQD